MATTHKAVSNATGTPEPLVIGQKKNAGEKVTLFILNDVEYKVARKVDPRIGLRLAERMAAANTEMEQMVAQLLFIKEMLGEEAYDVLMNDEDVSSEDFEAVLTLLQKVGLGESEAAKN